MPFPCPWYMHAHLFTQWPHTRIAPRFGSVDSNLFIAHGSIRELVPKDHKVVVNRFFAQDITVVASRRFRGSECSPFFFRFCFRSKPPPVEIPANFFSGFVFGSNHLQFRMQPNFVSGFVFGPNHLQFRFRLISFQVLFWVQTTRWTTTTTT